MKKILTFAMISALAISSQAATISWGNLSTSKIVGIDGVTALASADAITAGFSIQLMYLSSGDMTSYPGVAGTDTSASVASIGKTAGVLQNASDAYTFGTTYTTGADFFIRATATFNGTQYYMDIFENNTYGDFFSTAATTSSGSDTFVWKATTYGGVSAVDGVSGKWIAVPEPATAALALAGLAMLIRRRRA